MKKITIKDREVVITKMPFKKFMKVSGLLMSLNFEDKDAFATAADSIIEIFTLATDLDRAWLEENLDPVDAFTFLSAIREENNFSAVIKQAANTLKAKGTETS